MIADKMTTNKEAAQYQFHNQIQDKQLNALKGSNLLQ